MQPKFVSPDLILLHDFSQNYALRSLKEEFEYLWETLEKQRVLLNFPAVHPDVGSFLQFLIFIIKPSKIFEFGSGYGHSAFWYLTSDNSHNINKVVLTERRTDLLSIFNSLPWPAHFKSKMEYWQGDAFECWKNHLDADFILADGEKASYLSFLQMLEVEAKPGCWVVIDNSFWRGTFLDPNNNHESAVKMREFHQYLSVTEYWRQMFLPFTDGLTVLQKI